MELMAIVHSERLLERELHSKPLNLIRCDRTLKNANLEALVTCHLAGFCLKFSQNFT